MPSVKQTSAGPSQGSMTSTSWRRSKIARWRVFMVDFWVVFVGFCWFLLVFAGFLYVFMVFFFEVLFFGWVCWCCFAFFLFFWVCWWLLLVFFGFKFCVFFGRCLFYVFCFFGSFRVFVGFGACFGGFFSCSFPGSFGVHGFWGGWEFKGWRKVLRGMSW